MINFKKLKEKESTIKISIQKDDNKTVCTKWNDITNWSSNKSKCYNDNKVYHMTNYEEDITKVESESTFYKLFFMCKHILKVKMTG